MSINADGANGFDLYVGNYPGPSQDTMYFNNGAGFFTQVTSSHVPPDFDYTVDIAAADLNGDGKTDLLVSNDFDPNYVYYNNNQGQGTGLGDYRYGAGSLGGRQSLGFASGGENAMEPGDFDGDGDIDVYWNNRNSSTQDVILVNNGNLVNGMVSWTTLTTLPGSVTGHTSRKATVADLNDDGRDDLLVMKEDSTDSRPTILRNTTVNGQISFIDWTPGHAFPSGNAHKGWHSAVFDSDGDGVDELLIPDARRRAIKLVGFKNGRYKVELVTVLRWRIASNFYKISSAGSDAAVVFVLSNGEVVVISRQLAR